MEELKDLNGGKKSTNPKINEINKSDELLKLINGAEFPMLGKEITNLLSNEKIPYNINDLGAVSKYTKGLYHIKFNEKDKAGVNYSFIVYLKDQRLVQSIEIISEKEKKFTYLLSDIKNEDFTKKLQEAIKSIRDGKTSDFPVQKSHQKEDYM